MRRLFRMRIDRAKRVNCNLCARACPIGCIGAEKDNSVDAAKCATCFSCAGKRPTGALGYGRT